MTAALPMPAPVSDTLALRHALGRYTTGVTIVTTIDAHGHRVGLTVNSFNSLSLAPPLVLWALRTSSPSLAAFTAAPGFAVNVLAEDQMDLSRRFASHVPDKFALGSWSEGHDRLPLLAGAVAVFECERVSLQPAGDHVLFIGRVLRLAETERPPLVFRLGRYHTLGDGL